MPDVSLLKDFVPVVSISIIWGFVLYKYSTVSIAANTDDHKRSEDAHEAKAKAFIGAIEKKDIMYQSLITDQFSKQTGIMEKMTSVLEKIDTKLDTRISYAKVYKTEKKK